MTRHDANYWIEFWSAAATVHLSILIVNLVFNSAWTNTHALFSMLISIALAFFFAWRGTKG